MPLGYLFSPSWALFRRSFSLPTWRVPKIRPSLAAPLSTHLFGIVSTLPFWCTNIPIEKRRNLWTRLKRVYYEVFEVQVNNEIKKKNQFDLKFTSSGLRFLFIKTNLECDGASLITPWLPGDDLQPRGVHQEFSLPEERQGHSKVYR